MEIYHFCRAFDFSRKARLSDPTFRRRLRRRRRRRRPQIFTLWLKFLKF